MNSWLKQLYPDLQVTDTNLVGQNAEPTGQSMANALAQTVNNHLAQMGEQPVSAEDIAKIKSHHIA